METVLIVLLCFFCSVVVAGDIRGGGVNAAREQARTPAV